jgi:hypothetical protein
VSAFCVASAAEKPVAKDICGPEGKRYACDAKGDATPKDCPAETTCQAQGGAAICKPKGCPPGCDGTAMVAADCQKTDCAASNPDGLCALGQDGVPKCVDKACPAEGTATICLPDDKHLAIGLCQDGLLTKATCMADTQVCALIPGGALCASAACVPSAPNVPPPRQVCTATGQLLECNAQGEATLAACPAGSQCLPASDPATCVATSQTDAGSNGPDGGSGEDGTDGLADGAAASGDASATVDEDGVQYAAEDGGGMGAGESGEATAVQVASPSPPDSGCAASGQHQRGAVWLLAATAALGILAVRRRRT